MAVIYLAFNIMVFYLCYGCFLCPLKKRDVEWNGFVETISFVYPLASIGGMVICYLILN